MGFRSVIVLALLAIVISPASAQVSASSTFNPRPFSTPPIVGAPYSAIQISEHTQVLADGTHISQAATAPIHIYRDSAGRTRTERPFLAGAGIPSAVRETSSLIVIEDPVSGYQIVLDQVNRVAHRSTLPPLLGAPGTGRTASGGTLTTAIAPIGSQATANQRPEFSSESLGASTIEGVMVQGTLTKTTYPAGAIGNDQPIVTTRETWLSPELRLVILSKSSDPRTGDSITALSEINRAEPDPAVFQIPPGYEVVDETGPFTIKVTFP